MSARGAIFDMDGVLVDSGAHHRAAWRALLDELGERPAHDEPWRLTIGRPGAEAVPLLLGRRVAEGEARALARRKRAHYVRLARAEEIEVRAVKNKNRLPGLWQTVHCALFHA